MFDTFRQSTQTNTKQRVRMLVKQQIIEDLEQQDNCLQLLGLHRSPCSNAQREILNKPIEQDNVPN